MKYDSCILHDHQRLRQVGNPTIGNGTDQNHRLAPEPRSQIPPRIQSRNWMQCRSLSTASVRCKWQVHVHQPQPGQHQVVPLLGEQIVPRPPFWRSTAQESGLCITMAEERDAVLLYTDGRLHGSKIVWSVCKAG